MKSPGAFCHQLDIKYCWYCYHEQFQQDLPQPFSRIVPVAIDLVPEVRHGMFVESPPM
jgi:hypothetical protein